MARLSTTVNKCPALWLCLAVALISHLFPVKLNSTDAAVFTTRTFNLALKQKGFDLVAEGLPAMAATGIATR